MHVQAAIEIYSVFKIFYGGLTFYFRLLQIMVMNIFNKAL